MYRVLTRSIAAVWLINGLVCKVLNVVPRHKQIVGTILGHEHAQVLTLLIGTAEVIMAMWVLSRYRPRLCTIVQISVVIAMNVLEFVLVPDLLLWGKVNSLYAVLFVSIVWYHEYVLRSKQAL